jgi:hypothetical protein
MKLVLLIGSIVIVLIAAILMLTTTDTLKHLFDLTALGLIGVAVFFASFLPIPSTIP